MTSSGKRLSRRGGFSVLLLAPLLCAAGGCRRAMYDQPKKEPFEASTFFRDGRAARPIVEETVPRGHLAVEDHLHRGKIDGQFVIDFPIPVDRAVLLRGRERYQIYCAPCHDAAGAGQGIVVARGFKQSESFHTDRLRAMPVGYYFDVITNGYGIMYGFAEYLTPEDRWAVTAYIRALQLSQHATPEEVPGAVLVGLDEGAS